MSTKPLLLTIALVFGSVLAAGIGVANEAATKSDGRKAKTKQSQPSQTELGLGVSSLPPALTSHLPEVIGKGRGILVSEVAPGSPADKAGLQKHDVLIRYDDQDLYSPEQLVKRVRNDQPGKQIDLEYVRRGELKTVKVTLGERPRVAPIERDWPGLSRRFDVPFRPSKPDFLTEDQDARDDGTEWTHFESMSVMKDTDGKFRAEVTYKGDDGASVNRQYTGTRQEVRDAIESDEKLPESQKQQLLRSLDDRGEPIFPDLRMPRFPNWAPWSRELFDWPDVRF